MTREKIIQEPVDDYRIAHEPEDVQNQEYWTLWNTPWHIAHQTAEVIKWLNSMGRKDLIEKVVKMSDKHRLDGD